MAEIVLGMGMSHGIMLGLEPENWTKYAEKDPKRPEVFFQNKDWKWNDLVEYRAPEKLARYLTDDEVRARHAACMTALDKVTEVYEEVRPDIAVIFGNDQLEGFRETIPTFAVHWGKTVENGPGARGSNTDYAPNAPVNYPGSPELGLHIIETLKADKIDFTSITETPAQKHGDRVIPHAFGFVYHRIMKDNPPPSVPVYLNTMYPPNQPSIERCIEFGKSVARAIQSWDSDKRVALIGSGGLSHFVLDEQTDRRILDALQSGKIEDLSALGELTYRHGTSETKNLVPVAVAMREFGLKMDLIDYVPCYRSIAGNGQGMIFAVWRH